VSTNWLLTLGVKQRKQVLVGNLALCWPIWMSKNEVIFYKSLMKTYMRNYRKQHTGGAVNEFNFNLVRMT
jgi:hypothetical protein